jgi:GTP:adenosylcobinamide-phosphate guanylyltransferase
MTMENAAPLTCLVLAASRKGVEDPVAKLQNRTHKCLVTLDGKPMLERVIQALLDSRCFTRILVSIENDMVLAGLPDTQRWLKEGRIALVPSADNLADSLIQVYEQDDTLLPVVITTADNALHTPALVRDFVNAFMESDADVSVGATPEEVVLKDYANEGFNFFRFRDGGYSFCNLFGVRTAAGVDAVNIFRSGGQFRKKPWRILKVFGLMPLIRYKFRLSTFTSIFSLVGSKLGIRLAPVLLDYPFGPVDVDNANSFRITEMTLKKRRRARV